MATVVLKGGTEKMVILGVRESVLQQFQAPNWVDLRVGFFLSVTQAAADDTITGLVETISGVSLSPPDRVFVGLKTLGGDLPGTTGQVFVGWHNHELRALGNTQLISSDIGIGTVNSNYWRPANVSSTLQRGSVGILDGIAFPVGADKLFLHLVQNVGGAGGYSSLFLMRLTRPVESSKVVTATFFKSSFSTDVLYTSDPSKDALLAQLETFPATVQQVGPKELTAVPECFFLYWPFHGSRLRIHCMGFLRVL